MTMRCRASDVAAGWRRKREEKEERKEGLQLSAGAKRGVLIQNKFPKIIVLRSKGAF